MSLDRKRRMIIHCASGINNSGDEAILSVLLKRYKPDFDIAVISLNKDKTLLYHPDIECYSNNEPICKKIVAECDIFILGGGGLLQDETTVFNIFRWTKYLKIAIKHNRFTMLYANSIGPLNYSISKIMVFRTLRNVKLITLRDYSSKKLLSKLGICKNVYVTNDPVFAIQNVESDIDYNVCKKIGLPDRYICIAIRHWFDTIPFVPVSICSKLQLRTYKNKRKYEKYIQNISEITDYCNHTIGLPVVFISMLVDRDNKPAEEVLNRCSQNKNLIINNTKLMPQDIMSIIAASEFLIGMRLHSIIYAINTKTPFVALAYSEKVVSLLEKFQLADINMDINNFSVEEFKKIYNSVSFQQSSKKINEKMSQIIREERYNVDLMTRYYFKSDAK